MKGYYRKTDETNHEDGILVILEDETGAQFMRKYLLKYDSDFNPLPLIRDNGDILALGTDKIEHLVVNNKFAVVSIPSISQVRVYQTENLANMVEVLRSPASTQAEAALGQSITLDRNVLDGQVESHNLYMSQRYK